AWLQWVDPADGPQQPRLAGTRPRLAPSFPRFAPIATDRRRLPAVARAADTGSLSGCPADGAGAGSVLDENAPLRHAGAHVSREPEVGRRARRQARAGR